MILTALPSYQECFPRLLGQGILTPTVLLYYHLLFAHFSGYQELPVGLHFLLALLPLSPAQIQSFLLLLYSHCLPPLH